MSFGKTVNLGNSIIGVSILAMPYCFAQSGLILSILLIVLSGFFTRLSCHFLLKSAFVSKRRSFELLVQDVLGSAGRLLVELGLVGFLLGTCVAYFIMIGDLAPKILSELIDIKCNRNLRIASIIALGLFVALPLSLLKRVDSLTSFSLLSMILYSCLILKLMFETTDKINIGKIDREKLNAISYWNISGLLTTFPIFSMAMSCQTSLFEIFDSSVMNSDFETVRRDNGVIKKAIYVCSFVYITVGLLGYTAFHDQPLYGNILLAFTPSLTTTLTKIGFIVTLLMSFPLCLFPCRTSVYSLTFGKLRRMVDFQPLTTSSDEETFVKMNCDPDALGRNPKDIICDNDKNNNDTCMVNDINPKESYMLNNNIFKNTSTAFRFVVPTQDTWSGNSKNAGHFASLLEDSDQEDRCHNYSSHILHHQSAAESQQQARLYISDFHFKLLTIILIGVTVILSLMFPHIEFILGIIGSTAGTTVCFVLPAYTFIQIGEHSRLELFLARLLLVIGLSMLIFCSYSTVRQANLSTPID